MNDLKDTANAADGPNAKVGNPKDAVGIRKARWFSYIPLRVLVGVGLALFEGARKYGKHNYREAGVRASVYIDACVSGHLTPWTEGEDIDPDSGLNHIDKAIASLVVLRDGMLQGNWVDDRPPSIPELRAFFAEADKKAIEIIDRYPNAKEPFTEKRRREMFADIERVQLLDAEKARVSVLDAPVRLSPEQLESLRNLQSAPVRIFASAEGVVEVLSERSFDPLTPAEREDVHHNDSAYGAEFPMPRDKDKP